MHHVPRNPLTKCYVQYLLSMYYISAPRGAVLMLYWSLAYSRDFPSHSLAIESISELSFQFAPNGSNHAFPDSVQCTIAKVAVSNTKAGFTMRILRHGSRDRSSDPRGSLAPSALHGPRWTLRSRAEILLLEYVVPWVRI